MPHQPTIVRGKKLRGEAKILKPLAAIKQDTPVLKKPDWLRVAYPLSPQVRHLKKILREANLHTVCEEASCPNIGECFGKGTATFMIMGDVCTRRCSFCDVAHGHPLPLDQNEPLNFAQTIQRMKLRYVVITSVDRDDLKDGGAAHFVSCIKAVRELCPQTKVEILVPDFRGRLDRALSELNTQTPDVFNHNIETVPRLYKTVRPGADYVHSLTLLKKFKQQHPSIPTKSGIMLGLGEDFDEATAVLKDLREHDCDMVTIGQYLQPSKFHAPVQRYCTLKEFDMLGKFATSIGFSQVASGPLVRSSYHAEQQAASLV